MGQTEPREGRRGDVWPEAFQTDVFGREILPTGEKFDAAFVRLRERFRVWIARAQPRFVMRLIQNAGDGRSTECGSEVRRLR